MSIIGNISGVPLFSTKQEALDWAFQNGLNGYHTHRFQNKLRYMGGSGHQQATGMSPSNIPSEESGVAPITITPQTPTSRSSGSSSGSGSLGSSGSGSSGSSGGGGGY